jgi:hypothetical protein
MVLDVTCLQGGSGPVRGGAAGVGEGGSGDMGWDLGEETHRAGVLKLLEGFRKRGTPVDALGVQSHLGGAKTSGPEGFAKPDEKAWRAFLDEVTGMGYAWRSPSSTSTTRR